MKFVKKIAYILTTYPCPSEMFAAREIQALRMKGLDIAVFAAAPARGQVCKENEEKLIYRPSTFSLRAFFVTIYMSLRFPFSMARLFSLIFQFMIKCPSEALTIIANIHTICFFARTAKLYDINHIHAYFLSWPACIGLAVARMTKIPFSIAAHARDIYVEHGAAELKILHAEFIVCCTRQGLFDLQKKVSNDFHHKFHLNYHGIDDAKHSKDCGNAASVSCQTILAVGRLVQKKGFEYLIKTFRKLQEDRPHCKLIIAGDGPERQNLMQMAERCNIAKSVNFVGWLEHSAMLELIGHANLLVVPSIVDGNGDRDGIPNVILEAFYLRTAVVASSLEGITEAIQQNYSGLLVEPANIGQLFSALSRLLDDEELYRNITTNAYQYARKRFNITANCTELLELFEVAN